MSDVRDFDRKAGALAPIEVQSLLDRTRQVDPSGGETAISGYLREIVEAETALDAVDLSEIPLAVSFSASWEGMPRS